MSGICLSVIQIIERGGDPGVLQGVPYSVIYIYKQNSYQMRDPETKLSMCGSVCVSLAVLSVKELWVNLSDDRLIGVERKAPGKERCAAGGKAEEAYFRSS